MCYYFNISVTIEVFMYMKKNVFALIFLILILSLSGFSYPEIQENSKKDKDVKEKQLHPHHEIVVTATMTRKAVKDCSASVSVVGETDLKATTSSNAMNLLASLPGIFVRKTGDFGRSDVDIRGIGQRGRRIAVLVDGRPEKMGLFGCAVTHTFPLDNVERIEVVRGPSSVLYGSEAMGGVVNILTHEPRKKTEIALTSSYGSFDTKQLNLHFGQNLKKFKYFFTLDKRQSDGHRENSGYSGDAFTGKVIYEVTEDLEVSFRGKYFAGKKYEAGSIEFPLVDFWNDYERGAVDLTLKREGEKDEALFKAYRNFGHHQFSDGWHSRDYTNGGILRFTTHRIPNNELTAGIEARNIGGKSYSWPAGEWKKSEIAFFIHDEFVFKKKLIFSTGIRLNRDSLYGYEICPHWGVVFQADNNTRLRGMINKGFRSPQLNELFMYPAANPDLKPERIWNFEIGLDQRILSWLDFDISLFRMQGSNLVETGVNPSPPPQFLFMNTGKFTFTGAELGINARFSTKLTSNLFFTCLDPCEKTKGRTGQKWDLSLRFEDKALFASLQAQYITDYFGADHSQNPLPSYLLLNARAAVELSRFINIFLDINNILDTDYLIYLDLPGLGSGSYPMPERNISLGITLKH
jgi:outer membrane cobalamin receptor